MDKLSVFSKKLGQAIDINFNNNENLSLASGSATVNNGVVCIWNDTSIRWYDNGWNNHTSWLNHGWNNTPGSFWTDSGWGNSSSNWNNCGSGGGGGCFITTACVESCGLDDNCEELQTLRHYRDIMVEHDEQFRTKVLEYYRKAPLIVQEINKEENPSEVYKNLYTDMIRPCFEFLKSGEQDKAKTVYLDSYEKLVNKYLN